MSWYNQENFNFIDATQKFEGISSSSTNINGGTGELTDILELKEDYLNDEYDNINPTLAYNLYLKNNNIGGEIRFLVLDGDNNNDNSNLKYNVKIGNDGKLYLYYTFNFLTSATIFSGWIEISDFIVGVRQGVNNNSAAIATAGLSIASNSTRISSLETTTFALTAATQALTNDLQVVNANVTTLNAIAATLTSGSKREIKNRIIQILENVRGNPSLNLARSQIRVRTDNAVNALSSAISISSTSTTILQRISNLKFTSELLALIIGGGGVVGLVLGYIYKYIDDENKKAREEEITESIRYLEEIQNTPTYQVIDNIHLQGLTIVSATNNNFTTAGEFEEVSIINGAILHIKISGNPLVATIENVIDGGSGFNVGDIITISKIDLGGGTGNLEINVTSLISRVKAFTDLIDENRKEILNTDNRNRRRQLIPNKNDFSDGLNVTETFTTEPTGESLSQLNISLKLDTSQFNYDATGNLQLINYSQIAQNQTDISTNSGNISAIQTDISSIDTRTGNLETYTASLQTQINTANVNIAQNTTDIANNSSLISTNHTINQLGISTNAQSIITINNTLSSIQTDINNLQSSDNDVYKLLLNNNETYSTTTDHTVNIGFNKEEFSNVLFNLIMGAVKVNSGLNDIPFNINDFSGFYFGTYPNMKRLNYNEVITLVKQDNSKYYNDNTNWNNGGLVQMGAYYFTNISSGVVYDLNKRFEWYGNVRFRNLDSSGNNYIIRTAYEFEEVEGIPQYDHDINKMAFYYRDGNFYFSHLCKYNLTYYAIRLNQDILGDSFLNPIVTFTNTTPVYGNSAGYLDLNVTGGGFNEQLYLSIKESFYTVTRATIEGLINISPNTNPLFCGMVQSDLLTTHDPFGIIRLEYPEYTSGNLFKIARLEIEYQIMRNNGYYDGSGNWISTGWIPAIPQTQQDLNNMYEELVIDFYQSYSDTSPSLTVLIDTRQFYSTTTNTIIINFDLSPDLYTYTYEKWIIKPRFTAQFSSGYPSFGVAGYHLVPNQRSAFIHKVKMFRYIQKTITRQQVEEFTDGVNHTLSSFNYNKIALHIGLNRNIAPFQDIWYKLNDNLDINKYTITIPQIFNTTNLSDITDLPPNVSSLPVDNINLTEPFFISSGQPTITESNHILIIGDENLSNRLYITHYGWRFLLPTDSKISENDLNNFDYVKNYNYYHRTAVCDRFFSCKEFYADVIDFKRLLIDGNLSYDEMTTSEFSTLSTNSDGNNIKSLASVNIQNLYGLTSSGYLYFDTVNGFSTNSGSGGSSYWTQLNPVTIYYPDTIECDRVNATTLVLSGVASSITFSDGSYLQTASGLNSYTDADVINVLSQSASPTISWDATNSFFVVNQSILSDIANNNTAITTNAGNIATNATNIATNTADIATNAGNIATNTADLTTIFNDISFTNPSYLTFAKNIQLPNGDIISSVYNDTNVSSLIQNSAGTNLVWNTTTNKIDLASSLSVGSGFTYNNANGTLSVLKFSGNGSSLSQLDANNINAGTLPVTRGGTGKTSFLTSGGLLIGNPSGNPYSISQDVNLTYDVTSSVLKVNTIEFADLSQISTAPITTPAYTDADVRSVLSSSGSTFIIWDNINNQFNLDINNISSLYTGNVNSISDGYLRIAKNNGSGGVRSMRFHYNSSFDMCWSDYGNTTITETTPFRIAYTAPQNSVYINGSGELEVLNDIIVGKGGDAFNSTPTIFLDGANQKGVSSQIVFGDSGGTSGGIYRQGFSILYDSAFNKLKITADADGNSALDLPHYLTISRGTGYIGISNDYPAERLDVVGNIKLNGSIIFNDSTTISSNQLYLCKAKYASLGNIIATNSWVTLQNQFDTTFLINEGGFAFNADGIVIPVSGYYEVNIVNYFFNITTDRASLISAIAINGSVSFEDYICGSYIRFDSGARGSRGNAGTITKYFNAGEAISTSFYETGDSSLVNISVSGSSFTIKKIG